MSKSEGPLAVLETNESKSRPGKFYEIRIGGDGKLYCTCPGCTMHDMADCTHLKSWKSRHDNWEELTRGV